MNQSSVPSYPSWRDLLTARPTLAVLVVCAIGAALELSPWSDSVAIFSNPTRDVHDNEAPTAPSDPTVGTVELTVESRSPTAMAIPDGRETSKAPGFIGGAEAPLDLPSIEAEAPPVDLLDPSGKALDNFFFSLTKTQKKLPGAITRIAHFGDSVIVSDYVSGTLRQKLQTAFGDAGHGYMIIANAWPAYFHNDVFRFATNGFTVSRIVGPLAKDGLHGLGGVSFTASRGALAQFGTAEKGDFGRNVSRFVLSYLAYPGGGTFELWADGQKVREVSSDAPQVETRREELLVADGEHRFELRHQSGVTRSFGVVLERDVPGVVLDALGVQGARIRFLDKQDDSHYADELKWRNPQLIVYQFGANESGDGYAYPMDEYLLTMKAVIKQGQDALPESSCLIIGAMDRARVENGVTTSMKIIQLIVEQQEKAARELGCAYFDTYRAMGGWGAMPNWVKRGLGQADMTHPTGVGAIRIGNWIFQALMKDYDAYLQRMQNKD